MSKRILILAGGTGGHIFPALVIARRLQELGYLVAWLGTKKGLEASLVPRAGIPLHFCAIQGIRGKGLGSLLKAPFLLCRALYQTLQLFRQIEPDLLIGMGGFVAGPAGIAGWLLRIPLVIHEQNAVPCLTNRLLSPLARVVLESFPASFPKKRGAILTGNPVRREILALPPPEARQLGQRGPLRLLVLGGSLGAKALNLCCPQALKLIPREQRPVVWHQTGKERPPVQALYDHCGVEARVDPFIEEMAEAYAWADLVVCRAGAMTLTELTVVGLPSILVPFPYATDDHQTQNGRFLEAAQAAVLMPQSGLTPEWLAQGLISFNQNREVLMAMAKAAWGLGRRDALEQIIQHCLSVL